MIRALRRVEMKRRSKLRKGLRIKDRKVLLIFFIQILGKNFLQFTLIIAFTSTTNMNIDGIKIDIICGFLRPFSPSACVVVAVDDDYEGHWNMVGKKIEFLVGRSVGGLVCRRPWAIIIIGLPHVTVIHTNEGI